VADGEDADHSLGPIEIEGVDNADLLTRYFQSP
jgi:hypothetical protein